MSQVSGSGAASCQLASGDYKTKCGNIHFQIYVAWQICGQYRVIEWIKASINVSSKVEIKLESGAGLPVLHPLSAEAAAGLEAGLGWASPDLARK